MNRRSLRMVLALGLGGLGLGTVAGAELAQAQMLPPLPDLTEPTRPAPLPPVSPPPAPEVPLEIPPSIEPSPPTVPPELEAVRFWVERIEVLGNTVLGAEIAALTQPLEGRELSLSDLLKLRTDITTLYGQNGYATSGAFLPTNQDLTTGVVQIQVIEGRLEAIQVNGLTRLQEAYVRNRVALAAQPPLNLPRLEEALRLLQIDPLLAQVNAELTAGSGPGQDWLILDLVEANPFTLGFTLDNSISASTGSVQIETLALHRNVGGWGDFASLRYGHTQGLDLYEVRYGVPLNAYDGVLQVRYESAHSRIITPQFVEAGIRNESETLALSFRQPLTRSITEEWALGLAFDLRENRSFILNDLPFSFSVGPENGVSRVSALRFSQEWLRRDVTRVLAARSQFSVGLDLFNATVNNTGTDGRFLAWLGQFQWVEQLPPGWLLVSRVNAQITPDSLLPLERFSLGGPDTVRGYGQNQIVTDNALLGSVELRIPLSALPNELQLIPFLDVGTGWNNQTANPNPTTLVGTGLGLQWQPVDDLNLSLTYGLPLVGLLSRGTSLQENGFYFSLTYQPFSEN